MKSRVSLIIVIISALVNLSTSTLVQKSRQKRRVCLKGQQLCGTFCYDPSFYSCHEANQGRRRFLCHQNERSCGDKCYDQYEQVCHGYGDTALPCPWGHQPCGQMCYDPKSQMCNNNLGSGSVTFGNHNQNQAIIRPKPIDNFNYNIKLPIQSDYSCSAPCGSRCYDPSKQTCYTDNQGTLALLCPKSHKRCGNQCYDPVRESCSENYDYVISSSSPSMGSGGCSRGHSLCEGRCYNPLMKGCLLQKPNPNDKKITGGGNVGNFVTNNPYGFGPLVGTGTTVIYTPGLQCGPGQVRCGNKRCYDLRREVCFEDSGSGIVGQGQGQQKCNSGQEPCGKKCYDPFSQRCVDDGQNGKLICRWTERACGNRCYDPSKESCRNL